MKLVIKNMVCLRCKLMVAEKLKKSGLTPVQVELGEVTVAEEKLSKEQHAQLSGELNSIGFELLDDRRKQLIAQIKALIVNEVHHNQEPAKEKYSHLIAQHLHHDYSYLSKLFSEVEGITIEQYIIHQKIEKVKELLIYGTQSLTEIAFELGYSSTAHLSSQFKKTTGQTPTQFKLSGKRNRKSLDNMH